MKPTQIGEKSEFSRIYDVSRLNTPITIKANAEERTALARRLELESIESLEGELVFRAGKQDTTLLEGTLRAQVTQTCVITLEPVPATLTIPVETTFDDAARVEALLARTDPEAPEFLDIPEPVSDGKIDLGEFLVQILSLSLDPYPRKEGATFDGYEI